MDAQRLRNLTTGILHTKMYHIYEDLEYITGMGGIFTHMIPRIMQTVAPWLRENVTDERFWDGKFDQTHEGDYPLRQMSKDEVDLAMKHYATLPNPLENKPVVVVEAY